MPRAILSSKRYVLIPAILGLLVLSSFIGIPLITSGGSSTGGPHLVQQNSASTTSKAFSLTVPFNASVTKNDCIVVAVASNESQIQVTDGQINSFNLVNSVGDSSSDFAFIYYANASSSGPDSVTVALGMQGVLSVFIYELFGYSLSGVQFSTGNSGSGASVFTQRIDPTNDSFGIAIISSWKTPITSFTPGTGHIASKLQNYGAAEYSVSMIKGTSYMFSATQAGSSQWEEMSATFPPKTTSPYPASTIAISTTNQATMNARSRKIFLADGLYWLFYLTAGSMYYATSDNLLSWSAPILVSTPVGLGTAGEVFDVWHNSTNIIYAIAVGATSFYYSTGVLSNTGSITWGSVFAMSTSYIFTSYPSLVASGPNIWVAVGDNDPSSFVHVQIYKCSLQGACSLSYDYNSSQTGNSEAGTLFSYDAASNNIGMFYGMIKGGSGPAYIVDYNSSNGSWGAPVPTAHMEPVRVSDTILGRTVYFGGACGTGAPDVCFWSHNYGNRTSPNFITWGTSALGNTLDEMEDVQGTLSFSAPSTFVIFFANSEEISSSTSVYYIRSNDLGKSWSQTQLLTANENDVWGGPGISSIPNDTGRASVVWTTGQPGSQSYDIRLATLPLGSKSSSTTTLATTSMTITTAISSSSTVSTLSKSSSSTSSTSSVSASSTTVTTTSTSSSSSVIPGVIYHNNKTVSLIIYLSAFATVPGTYGSVTVSLGTSSPPPVIFTEQISGSTTNSATNEVELIVPAGYYYSFSASGATFGTVVIVQE